MRVFLDFEALLSFCSSGWVFFEFFAERPDLIHQRCILFFEMLQAVQDLGRSVGRLAPQRTAERSGGNHRLTKATDAFHTGVSQA